jgi:hypothetical protein
VLDVRTGETLALGSYPTVDPSIFTRPLSKADARRLWDEDQGAPMFNRAISGAYPVGSVYKPFTALAGMDQGIVDPSTVIQDGGKITVAGQTFTNAGKKVHGPVDLRRALEVSSDVYFYRLGQRMNGTDSLQDWSRQFGIGQPTGIDLVGESRGLLPTPAWRNALYRNGETDRPWAVGDNIQLAIGQGDLQANPLQIALGYKALGNGGTVFRPGLVRQVEDAAGRVLSEFEPEAVRLVPMPEGERQAIIVDDVPYQVNKARMVERIAEVVRERRVEGISDLRDESDRHGVRVVIELKRDADPDVVLNQLYKFTPLQTNFGVNMVALAGGRIDAIFFCPHGPEDSSRCEGTARGAVALMPFD